MGVWSRSWSITRTSFGLMGKDKEMIWFPILSAFFSLLFSAALLVPTFVLKLVHHAGAPRLAVGPLQIVVLFVTYFGLSVIATFFNVCVVHTTRTRLQGGDATFMDSINFALSRLHRIIGWSLVAATVGILLRGLDALAERAGFVGKILLSLLRSLLALAWSISTVFVVPAMVFEDLGPIDAIKDSIETLKKTWGESLVRYYGMGLASFVCSLPFLLVILGGVFTIGASPAGGIALVAIGIFGLVAVGVLFGVAKTVFNTVLYHWAKSGATPEGVDTAVLQAAFARRG